MRVRLVLGVVGHQLRLFAIAFVIPALLALYDLNKHSALWFAIGGAATFCVGFLCALGFEKTKTFHRAEALAVVSFTWLFVALCGAVPYVLYGLTLSEAFFETMSGFTATGATILTDFDRFDRSFFLWRSMSQWFGGIGVIALFVVVLPRLGIAGRQLFFAEASGAPSEAISPQIRKSARSLWLLYSGLTLLVALLLKLVSGFPWFDALCHAMTTVAAGGFSPHGQSIAGYGSTSAEWILCFFMLIAGASFTLQYKAISGRPRALVEDGEFVAYASALLLISVTLSILLSGGVPTLEAFRTGLFQTASVMSSTGYASTDYNLWSDSARGVLIVAMLIGGCAGSAAGGPKVIRWLLVLKHVSREITNTLHPRAILAIRYKNQPISRDIMRAVFTLVVLYLAGYFVLGTVLVLMGADLVLGYSSALACLGNIGPALGPAGPMGSFSGFGPIAKVLLALAMWCGRLEIVTILALLHVDVLRNLRLKDASR